MKLTDLRTIKSLADLDRADLPPKELKDQWWRPYGRSAEPTSSSALMDLAGSMLQTAMFQLSEATQKNAVTAEVERDVLDTLATVREIKRRADGLRSQEFEAQKAIDPRMFSDLPTGGPRDGAPVGQPSEAKTYRALFGKQQHQTLNDGEFKSFGEFLRVVGSGRWDPRLETKTTIAGDASLGGFAVPELWASFLFDGIVNESAILPRARVVPMTSLQLHIPAWDDLNQSTGVTYGGFAGAWLGEGATATEETAKVRQITLTAHKLAIFTSISREAVLGTQGTLQNELRLALTRAVAAKLDAAFLTGTDVGQPEGVLNAPALKGVTRTTAGTVKYADLVNVYAGLHPAFAARATFYLNPSVVAKLLTIEDTAGHLIWQPSGRDAAPTTLFGRPVVYSDRLPALGSKGDVMALADGGYVVGILQNILVDVTTAADWKKDLVSLRCIVLVDGQVTWDKLYTAPDAATYSTAVVLNA